LPGGHSCRRIAAAPSTYAIVKLLSKAELAKSPRPVPVCCERERERESVVNPPRCSFLFGAVATVSQEVCCRSRVGVVEVGVVNGSLSLAEMRAAASASPEPEAFAAIELVTSDPELPFPPSAGFQPVMSGY